MATNAVSYARKKLMKSTASHGKKLQTVHEVGCGTWELRRNEVGCGTWELRRHCEPIGFEKRWSSRTGDFGSELKEKILWTEQKVERKVLSKQKLTKDVEMMQVKMWESQYY
jgi:hypothetical protein